MIKILNWIIHLIIGIERKRNCNIIDEKSFFTMIFPQLKFKLSKKISVHYYLLFVLNFTFEMIFYYMEESVLLGTKHLVDSTRHFMWDPSGIFSVCHLCECRIVQWRHYSRLLLLLNWFLHIIKRSMIPRQRIKRAHNVISKLFVAKR